MRSILAAWLIVLFSLTNLSAENPATHLQLDGKAITVDGYWELVRNTRQSILQMESKPAAEIRQQLNLLVSQWNQVTAVELPDHNIIPIDSTYLIRELQKDPPDLKHLSKSLDVLLNAHEKFPGHVFTLKDVNPLKEVLAQPEFQWNQGQAVEMPNWLANIFDAISKFLDRVTFALANFIYQTRYILMIGAAILLILSLFYISRNLSRSLVRDAQLAEENSENQGVLTSKGAIQRAQNLSMQGDYRNAIRYLYLSSLLVLDEQGLLRYDRSRTNREYLRSVSSHPELANPLRDVIDVFDRVWYGFESVDEQTYRSYKEHVDELREKKE